jgi:hypothetical protein
MAMADRGALGLIGWMLGVTTLAVSLIGAVAVVNFPPQVANAAVTVAKLSGARTIPFRAGEALPR